MQKQPGLQPVAWQCQPSLATAPSSTRSAARPPPPTRSFSTDALSDLHLELSSARGSCRWTFGEMLALYGQKASHQSHPRSLPCLCAPEECPKSAVPTVLSSRYFCHMSTVSPELALQGTSGDTMLWLTRAERWVRTVERCLQYASPASDRSKCSAGELGESQGQSAGDSSDQSGPWRRSSQATSSLSSKAGSTAGPAGISLSCTHQQLAGLKSETQSRVHLAAASPEQVCLGPCMQHTDPCPPTTILLFLHHS